MKNRRLVVLDADRASRRAFMKDLAAGLALVPVGIAAAACGPGELTCTDVAGLSADDQQKRTTLKYVDRSTFPEKRCENCAAFQPKAPDQCGGCTDVPGPIHPKGYCNVWRQKT